MGSVDTTSPATAATQGTDPSFYEGRDLDVLVDIPNYYSWILDQFRKYLRGRVIEVGAGIGNVAARYADWVDELLLVEPAKNLYPRLRERFAARANVQTRCALVETLRDSFRPFDSAVLINVLEHVSDDLGMLRTLHAMLKPRGALLLYVPAMPFLFGSLDRTMQHVRRYEKNGLTTLVEQAGFQLQSIRYLDVIGVIPWFVVGRVLKRRLLNARSTQAYDRWIVPAERRLEGWVDPPFGKNLICIAQKS
jgi:SAM-dependent methyltransferase